MYPEDKTLKHKHSAQFLSQDDVPPFMDDAQDKSDFQEKGLTVSEHFTSLVYGFQLDKHYNHEKTNASIMEVTYNNRLRQYVILDTRGIVSWKPDWIDSKVKRVLLYPKYQHRVITKLQYVKKYNCYFILDKEFTVKVLNKDFEEVYIMNSGTIGASFMVFNSVTDELFTGGIGGTKVWQYQRVSSQMFKEIKPLSDYELKLKKTLPNVGGSWVQRIEVNTTTHHLYCCSEMDVHVYNMRGNLLYRIERAHAEAITGCCFSSQAKVIITASHDTTVKVWSSIGGLLHVFHEHTRSVSNLQLHPENSLMFITSSHDGTIRIWSLETMDCLYCCLVSGNNNPMWMFFTDENQLVTCTAEEISVWFLNYFVNFWGLMRSGVSHMSLQYGTAPKTTRLLAVGDDGSIRLFAQKSHKKLCTILPPPCLSPLEELPGFCYSRDLNLVYLLLSTDILWIYTSRSDPACRLAVWNITKIQSNILTKTKQCSSVGNNGIFLTPAADLVSDEISQCISIGFISSPVEISPESSTDSIDSDHFLLWGLKDGRILFMDPIKKGIKHMELKASKGPIMKLHHNKEHNSLAAQSHESDHILIQIWSLPSLILQFSVTSEQNLTAWTRLENALLTGHDDGVLTWYLLTPTKDSDLENTGKSPKHTFGQKNLNTFGHKQAVIALDSCSRRKIFCSGSCDGNIKIWDMSGTILQEIILNIPLGSICFLNNKADLLIAFNNHIFYVPHSKVCPFMEQISFEDSSSAEDSDIYEDFFTEKEKEQNIDSYLMPYDINVSKHFSEDNFPELKIKECEEREEDRDSFKSEYIYGAPTEIYSSPKEQYNWSWPSMSSLTDGDLEMFSQNAHLQYPLLTDSPTELNNQSPREEISLTHSITDKSDDFALSTCTQRIDEIEGDTMPSVDVVAENVSTIKNDNSDIKTTNSSFSSDTPIVPSKISSENVQIDACSHTNYNNVAEEPETSLVTDHVLTSEDSKLTENTTKEVKNVPASPVVGDVGAVGKKSKMKKIESLKILKSKKGSNSAAHLVRKSEEKPSVVHIEIKPKQNQHPPVRKSTSLTGKKLHQNLSTSWSRHDYTESSLANGNQTGKSRRNVYHSNIQRKVCKSFEKSETEEKVDTSKKSSTGSSKFRIESKSKDQVEDDPDNQSVEFYPFTAPSFGHRYSEDLKTEFEMRLANFARKFSCNSSDKTPCHILFESGQTIEFGKDWVERHIERYILLLMLQKLRAQTAKEKHSRSLSQNECTEKVSYPLFNSVVWTNPEENNIELRQKIGFMSQNICHTTGYLKNTLYNRKLLKQKELNQFKLLSNPPNEQSFFDIKNLFAMDKLLSNVENKEQRGWSTTLFKRRHSTKQKSTSKSSSVDSHKNEQNLVDSFYEQNYKTANTIYKFRFTVHRNKKTSGNEPDYKFPNLPSNIWTAVHPRPFVHTKSIPVNDRDYEIIENSEKNTPEYLQPTRFEKKLLSVRFPVKEREYCKLVTVQNLVFEPESTPETK
ncbi:uncharacterized protein LOC106881343 isoform X1 [Octopus bimaculoides]|uniref:uncharacterized protein LOC106881343 isoform X1 n=1 Tax=Octopus bimaculoides TaxID=37653 RepID=UPI0022E53EDC|nr:uncharacterized protein LOC106881343 isoform X1 [Octopus bimaculoides]